VGLDGHRDRVSSVLEQERNLIENRLNREAKQHLGLGSSLTRTAAGMRTATYFSMMALLFYRVLEIRRTQAEDALEDPRYEKLGLVRYRRKLTIENRHKVLIYVDGRAGIFYLWDLLKIVGFDVM